MRKFLTALLVAVMLCAAPLMEAKKPSQSLRDVQQRAMYAIAMDNGKEGEERSIAGCTAYAIAEHVLLTAEHCNQPGNLYLNPDLDKGRSGLTNPVEVTQRIYDHMDHMLLVVSGVSFQYTIKYDPSKYKVPVQGEHIYFWGNPGMLPNQYRESYILGQVNVPPSESTDDASGPVYTFVGPVVGGDSGSALFSAEDGRLVLVLTYGINGGTEGGAYPLAFTKNQVEQAEGKGNVVYGPDTRPVIHVTIVNPPAPAVPAPTTTKPSEPSDPFSLFAKKQRGDNRHNGGERGNHGRGEQRPGDRPGDHDRGDRRDHHPRGEFHHRYPYRDYSRVGYVRYGVRWGCREQVVMLDDGSSWYFEDVSVCGWLPTDVIVIEWDASTANYCMYNQTRGLTVFVDFVG